MERSPSDPESENLSRFLIPAHSGKKEHVCQDTSYGRWTYERTDGYITPTVETKGRGPARESIVLRAVYKGRRLGGRRGKGGPGFGNLVHRQ